MSRLIKLVLLSAVAVSAAAKSRADSDWINPNTGDWFDAANWDPAVVPTVADRVEISNGGTTEALAATATGNVVAEDLDVGQDGEDGSLLVDGVDMTVAKGFDIGDVDSRAGDIVPLLSTADAIIRNSSAIRIGTESDEDGLSVGHARARDDTTAIVTGTLGLEMLALMAITESLDIGRARGEGTSNANGSLMASQITSFEIGKSFQIADAESESGQHSALGDAALGQIDLLQIDGDFVIGRARSEAGIATSDGRLSVTDATINIGTGGAATPNDLSIGRVVAANNGRGDAQGMVDLTGVQLAAQGDIVVGRLEGGGNNPQNRSDATLNLTKSLASANELYVARIEDGTAGAATGRLSLNASLVSIVDDARFGDGATLAIDIAGTARADGSGGVGQFGAIDADQAFLDGVLQIELTDGFVPVSGDSFQLISTVNGVFGQFDAKFVPDLEGGLVWFLDQGLNALTLEVLAPAFTADFNADNQVDGDDFLLWQGNFGRQLGALFSDGDSDRDGDVDGDDFLAWQSQFGSIAGNATGANPAVPEPSSVVILIAAVLLTCPTLRRRSK